MIKILQVSPSKVEQPRKHWQLPIYAT